MKYILEDPVFGTIGTEKFRTTIRWRGGELITDEPPRLGGSDAGPDPFTLLLTSLVSCTLATLRMYADLKELNIAGISVAANMFHRIAGDSTVLCIERSITLENVADEETRSRLLRVAENCPVSKMLKGNIRIDTGFADSGPDDRTDHFNQTTA